MKSEYVSYSPPAKDESKSAKASSRKSTPDDSEDESEEDFGRTIRKPAVKGKAPAKKCAIYGVKWYRVVLGAYIIKWVTIVLLRQALQMRRTISRT